MSAPSPSPSRHPALSGYARSLGHRPQLWRTLVAAVGGIAALLGLTAAAVPVGIAVDMLLGIEPFDPAAPSFTIGLWVSGNIMIALLIPLSMLLRRLAYGAGALRTMSSAAGRFRWGVLARAALVVMPVWLVYALAIQPALGTGAPQWTAVSLVLCVVALVTIPFQSAGEEYLFRGLIFPAIGARFARPLVASAVATAVTALQFGLIHGASDAWSVVYYIFMGVMFAVLTERTGGLELPVLIHATNNTLLLLPVILADELATVSTPSGPLVVIPILVVAIATAALWKMTPRITGAPQTREAAA
ncbi:CPBP family intramembrane glutamic endopeptidase [Homoserinibacter sp. YIM 151385]|uniref:CPBP family intramembrane glutamic endopeptidase n=1 Tax=Homoserinibacter sp. YIM 151385 TaxID=2985506 RepID=UPI0022F02FE2|nr:CPBP family intramembrane glutamic endopeptidase [Homoserinibacter sp. YIM 151385]WBU37153.1 CPBP family intramembrane metalloprotease [Homoserinibacter sp. YIM 151385]